MNHAPRCDCDECLPGMPVEHKSRVRVTLRDTRKPFKTRQLRATVEKLRARIATVVNG